MYWVNVWNQREEGRAARLLVSSFPLLPTPAHSSSSRSACGPCASAPAPRTLLPVSSEDFPKHTTHSPTLKAVSLGQTVLPFALSLCLSCQILKSSLSSVPVQVPPPPQSPFQPPSTADPSMANSEPSVCTTPFST